MIYQPPHEIIDYDKIDSMVTQLREGGSLPPVLVCGDQAFSGSHRLAAWDLLDLNPDVVEIEDDDYRAILESLGLDPDVDEVRDFEPFLDAAKKMGLAGGAE